MDQEWDEVDKMLRNRTHWGAEAALEYGDLHATSPGGETPLYISAYYGQELIINKLLKLGAECADGQTPRGVSPLQVAIKGYAGKRIPMNDGDFVDAALAWKPSNVSKMRNIEYPQTLLNIIDSLIEHGADVNHTDSTEEKRTPLLEAAGCIGAKPLIKLGNHGARFTFGAFKTTEGANEELKKHSRDRESRDRLAVERGYTTAGWAHAHAWDNVFQEAVARGDDQRVKVLVDNGIYNDRLNIIYPTMIERLKKFMGETEKWANKKVLAAASHAGARGASRAGAENYRLALAADAAASVVGAKARKAAEERNKQCTRTIDHLRLAKEYYEKECPLHHPTCQPNGVCKNDVGESHSLDEEETHWFTGRPTGNRVSRNCQNPNRRWIMEGLKHTMFGDDDDDDDDDDPQGDGRPTDMSYAEFTARRQMEAKDFAGAVETLDFSLSLVDPSYAELSPVRQHIEVVTALRDEAARSEVAEAGFDTLAAESTFTRPPQPDLITLNPSPTTNITDSPPVDEPVSPPVSTANFRSRSPTPVVAVDQAVPQQPQSQPDPDPETVPTSPSAMGAVEFVQEIGRQGQIAAVNFLDDSGLPRSSTSIELIDRCLDRLADGFWIHNPDGSVYEWVRGLDDIVALSRASKEDLLSAGLNHRDAHQLMRLATSAVQLSENTKYVNQRFPSAPPVTGTASIQRREAAAARDAPKEANAGTKTLGMWLDEVVEHKGVTIGSIHEYFADILTTAAGGDVLIVDFAENVPAEKLAEVIAASGKKKPFIKKLYKRLLYELNYPLTAEQRAFVGEQSKFAEVAGPAGLSSLPVALDDAPAMAAEKREETSMTLLRRELGREPGLEGKGAPLERIEEERVEDLVNDPDFDWKSVARSQKDQRTNLTLKEKRNKLIKEEGDGDVWLANSKDREQQAAEMRGGARRLTRRKKNKEKNKKHTKKHTKKKTKNKKHTKKKTKNKKHTKKHTKKKLRKN